MRFLRYEGSHLVFIEQVETAINRFVSYAYIRNTAKVLFGGLSLYYRFTVESRQGEPRFGVSVELGEERAEGELGNHLGRAWELYALVVKGAVTPCSLEDVLSDFSAAG